MTAKQEKDKKAAAEKVLEELTPELRKIGLGTGSTVKYFIEALGKEGLELECACSSKATEKLAKKAGLKTMPLNDILTPERPILDLYVDGADEVDKAYNLIKGGGGALLREKIIATASLEFICVVDESKIVKKLGGFPLPVEVLPFAEKYVAFEMRELGAQATVRKDFTTDNGNIILDVTGLNFKDPLELETEINNIPGVVENGVFSVRPADRVVVGKGGKAEFI